MRANGKIAEKQLKLEFGRASRFGFTGCGLCTPFCSIKWVAATKWVCTLELLVCAKWLHTPRVVLMLHTIGTDLQSILWKRHLYHQNDWKKLQPVKRLAEPTSHFADLYKIKLIFKRRDDLQNGVYKTGWLNPIYPESEVEDHFVLRMTPHIL